VPVWHKALQAARKNKEIVMLGVIQEQHAERCRLFAQWQQFDWPIVQDPNNLLGLQAVPIIVAIDEAGITRHVNPRLQTITDRFLKKDASDSSQNLPTGKIQKPDFAALRKSAREAATSSAWRDFGDGLLLWGNKDAISESILSYQKAVQLSPKDAALHFRLGGALRKRYDRRAAASKTQQKDDDSNGLVPQPSNDFQLAVQSWGKALEINPNQYIYRRRIQQYGPRLIKPYPFYDWVAQANKDITARGEKPIELTVTLSGAELASPSRRFVAGTEKHDEPDAKGKINRDVDGLIEAEVVVVPGTIRPGQSCRIHVKFKPTSNAHWNNEAKPLGLWLELPKGWQSEKQLFESDLPKSAESTEQRLLDFEIRPPADQKTPKRVKAYALYYVCEEKNGTCLFLRQDIEFVINIREPIRK
jgi:hypothetical protein